MDRQLIERESRAVPIWLGLANHLRNQGWNSPKFQAALRALIWKLLSPGGAAAGGVLLISFLTAYLAWQSNRLLQEQNRLITIQNQLQESARRAGLTVELTEVLNRVSDAQGESAAQVSAAGAALNCKQEDYDLHYKLSPSFGRKPVELSPALLGRVVALSKSFRPYRYLDVGGDGLGSTDSGLSELSSPERTQLLMALASSNVSIEQVSEAGAEFDRAPLTNALAAGLSLRKVIANQADWNGAILVHADLTEASLRWSRLVEVNATCARLDGANLSDSNLSDGQFRGASFRGADLTGSNLTIAHFAGADFSDADLRGAFTCDENVVTFVDSVEKLRELEESGNGLIVSAGTKFGKLPASRQPVCN
ncbi:MAG: pentapeptide repeat-containing protein [Burkholderiales bacterium]|nr:pentapeptide repeat-containing protein [Burkholderiales bacterium]